MRNIVQDSLIYLGGCFSWRVVIASLFFVSFVITIPLSIVVGMWIWAVVWFEPMDFFLQRVGFIICMAFPFVVFFCICKLLESVSKPWQRRYLWFYGLPFIYFAVVLGVLLWVG